VFEMYITICDFMVISLLMLPADNVLSSRLGLSDLVSLCVYTICHLNVISLFGFSCNILSA